MGVEVVTNEDLQQFRVQLLEDVRQLFLLHAPVDHQHRPWLKNADIKKLLGISSNTIQRLRITGQLKSSKIGGAHYYRYDDLRKLIEEGFEK